MRDITSQIQNNNYWWRKVSLNFEFRNEVNWFGMYIECKYGRRELFAIGGFLPVEQITAYLTSEINNTNVETQGDEIYGLLDAVLEGVIQLDDVEKYQKYVSWGLSYKKNAWNLFNDYPLVESVLRSNGGWKILCTFIPYLVKLGNQDPELRIEAAKSSDIAHYILLSKLFKVGTDSVIPDEISFSVVMNAPQNIPFYLTFMSEHIISTIEDLIPEKLVWQYSDLDLRINPEIRFFLIEFISYLSKEEIENCINTPGEEEKESVFYKLLTTT